MKKFYGDRVEEQREIKSLKYLDESGLINQAGELGLQVLGISKSGKDGCDCGRKYTVHIDLGRFKEGEEPNNIIENILVIAIDPRGNIFFENAIHRWFDSKIPYRKWEKDPLTVGRRANREIERRPTITASLNRKFAQGKGWIK